MTLNEPMVSQSDLPGLRFLHRMDARLKGIAAVTMIVTVVCLPAGHFTALLILGLIVAVLSALASLRLRDVLVRLLPLLPFILLSSLSMIWQHTYLVPLMTMAKSILCLLTAYLLVATTPMPALVGSLRWFRVPAMMVTLIAFMLRFLFVLQEETMTMHQAYLSRCGRSKNLRHTRFLGALIASLFLRTCRRSDRIHAAMLSRNFHGFLPAFKSKPLTWRQVTPFVIFVTAVIALGVIDF